MTPMAQALNPVLLTMPVERPEKFTGNRRDWRRFSRQFAKYDRDILSMGAVSEAARIRALEGLLDKAGQCKIATLQQQAELRGFQLTLHDVKAHLDQAFEVGPQDARGELKALAPS